MMDGAITPQEIMEALPILWQVNPLAQMQLVNLIQAKRLETMNAELARLKASYNGVQTSEPIKD